MDSSELKGTGHRVYIAGPMSGYREYNFPLFNEIAQKFRDHGFEVENPADNFEGKGHLYTRSDCMKKDYARISRCTGMVMLPDWQHSRGARCEYIMGLEAELLFFDYETCEQAPVPDLGILLGALHLTRGERNEHYGHPVDDFSCTMAMFTPVIEKWLKQIGVIGSHVGLPPMPPQYLTYFMQCVKISRDINFPKRDNWEDGAGYWNTRQMIFDKIGI